MDRITTCLCVFFASPRRFVLSLKCPTKRLQDIYVTVRAVLFENKLSGVCEFTRIPKKTRYIHYQNNIKTWRFAFTIAVSRTITISVRFVYTAFVRGFVRNVDNIVVKVTNLVKLVKIQSYS